MRIPAFLSIAASMLVLSALSATIRANETQPIDSSSNTDSSPERTVADPQETPAKAATAGLSRTIDRPIPVAPLGPRAAQDWLPMTRGPALMWIAVVVILSLTMRADPWLSIRNLDGIILAASCPLLLLRDSSDLPVDGLLGHAPKWWGYLLLSLIAGYWMFRGLLLVRARHVTGHACNVSAGAMAVLLIFGLSVAATAISTEPLSEGTIDGVLGGRYFATTGKLPHGQMPGVDCRSPLLYVLHGGAQKISPAHVLLNGNKVPPDWDTRENWRSEGWQASAELGSARIVNGLLAALILTALVIIGQKLHSLPAGLMMATVFCVFPGSVECLGRSEVLLPAALLSWTVAAALLPAGGLLSALLLVLAGTTWSWAWLGLPVLLAYFLRQGWAGLGAIAGTLAGSAAVLAGLVWLAQPALPRSDGAFAAAGTHPEFAANMTENNLTIDRLPPPAETTGAWIDSARHWIWRPLLAEPVRLSELDLKPQMKGASAEDVLIGRLDATEPARRHIQPKYAETVRESALSTQARVAIRMVLEATWLPTSPPRPPVTGAWEYWSRGTKGIVASAGNGLRLADRSDALEAARGSLVSTGDQDRWVMYRRIAKGLVVLVALVAGLMMLSDQRKYPHQFIGGLLAVLSGALIAEQSGAVADLALLLPGILPLLAAHCEDERELEAVAVRPQEQLIKLGPMPRISIEK